MSEPVVTVKQGQIKGHIRQTFDGENFYEFLGIPYAKPPIGSLRFKAPQPPECWTGVRDGTKEGNFAYCLDYFSGKICGSEDCLFLNVFIKQLPQSGCTLKPVMVYIHGGGFIGGSSALSLTGPKLILNEDVVLVTLNYRLGALGFLCIDDTSLDVPGNAGLKDQTMALRWVKENISYFNGDPNNVTIFGVSAGGAAVQFQILSPSAKGLFHKAIMQSGSALNPWAWGQKNSVELANLLKPGIKTEKEALEILVNAPVADLYSASIKITDNLLDSSKRRPFGPVVEKPNPTAFLTDNPIDILTSGSFSQVPLIQGVAANEGLIYEFLKNTTKIDPNEIPDYGISWQLSLKKNSQEYENIKNKIMEHYFKNGLTSDAIYEYLGDTMFIIGKTESLKLSVQHSSKPVYNYVLSLMPESTMKFRKLFKVPDSSTGAHHGAELTLLFDTQIIQLTDECIQASKKFVKMWSSFAKNGIPSTDDIKWDPVTNPEELVYLDISENSQMKKNPFSRNVQFWNEVLRTTPYDKASFNS